MDRVDVRAAAAVELVLDHVEQAAMQSLDQRQRFEIGRPHVALGLGLRFVAHVAHLGLQRRVHDRVPPNRHRTWAAS